jgi:predicted dehydrogenase
VPGAFRPLRVAVIGCGAVARQYHLRALSRLRGVDVIAVADPDAAARESAARRADAVGYADAADAFAHPGLDAAVVCAPSAAHADLAVTALESGLHLYLEKPLATTAADGRRVVAAAEASDAVVALGLAYRFDPLYARVRALLQEGVVGQLSEVSTSYYEALDPRLATGWRGARAAGGGVLLDLGVHQIDLMQWLTGRSLATVDDAEVESTAAEHDSARFTAALSGDVTFEAGLGYGDERSCRWVFAGDEGWLAVDRSARTWTLARDAGRARTHPRAGAGTLARLRSLPVLRRDRVIARALHAWIGAAHGRPTPELPTVHDGLRALEVVEAVEAAAALPAGV